MFAAKTQQPISSPPNDRPEEVHAEQKQQRARASVRQAHEPSERACASGPNAMSARATTRAASSTTPGQQFCTYGFGLGVGTVGQEQSHNRIMTAFHGQMKSGFLADVNESGACSFQLATL